MMSGIRRAGLVVVVLLSGCGAAVSRSNARSVGGADEDAPRVEGDVTTAKAGGIQIIVKRVLGAEFVSGAIFSKGGAGNWSREDAGVEELACAVAVTGGTQRMPKEAFAQRLAELGSTISSNTSLAYSVFRAKSLRADWNATFALLVDVFVRPALPPAEIEQQRALKIAELQRETEDPDDQLALLAHQTLFSGHPYANRPAGTVETVARLQRPALEAQLTKLRERTRLLLVVVGDVDAAKVIADARQSLGFLPAGHYVQPRLPPLAFSRPHLSAVARKLPTNYIVGQFSLPAWDEPGFPAALVAMELLSSRVFEEVRTKRNLSYAPAAYTSVDSFLPIGNLYATATDPNTTMKIMFGEARRLRDEVPPADELEGNKSVFLTGYLMKGETTDGLATLLGAAEIYAGDWRFLRTLPQRIHAVTAADIQAFARAHIVNLQTVVLGDAGHLDSATFSAL